MIRITIIYNRARSKAIVRTRRYGTRTSDTTSTETRTCLRYGNLTCATADARHALRLRTQRSTSATRSRRRCSCSAPAPMPASRPQHHLQHELCKTKVSVCTWLGHPIRRAHLGRKQRELNESRARDARIATATEAPAQAERLAESEHSTRRIGTTGSRTRQSCGGGQVWRDGR